MTEVIVDRLGQLGDGIARQGEGAVIVPGGLPGERHRVDGADFERLSDSPSRRTPSCPHFGQCGGCTLQHLAEADYLAFKTDLVRTALRKTGARAEILALVADTRPCPPASRRRLSFSAKIENNSAQIGFLGRASHTFVPIDLCTIAVPAIVEALPDLRAIAAQVLRGAETITLLVTACDTGLDIAISAEKEPTPDMLAALVRTASRTAFLRISVNGEIIFEREKPLVRLGRVAVAPPPGSFLQAVPAAEAAMADMVVQHCARGKRIADLFCGSGTFTFPLAQKANTTGYESDGDAVRALLSAGQPSGHKGITAHERDLFETPLTARELRAYDTVCLDPPRAGAAQQSEQLAKSDVQRIAYVSCNPKTFAEDLAVLIAGGYDVTAIQPFDQFLYAPHVEIVGLLEKRGPAKRKRIF
ncbi:MAG: RNA methyltransferase [Pseudomonadota bacterium]